jgi:sugar phosphate isomerase/epimerase
MAIKLGVITSLTENPSEPLSKVAEMGLPTFQLNSWDPTVWTDEIAKKVTEASKQYNVEVSSFWAGYPGPGIWDFIDGPSTLGFVPPEYREMRVEAMMKAVKFAVKIGAPSISTHAGFIPESPKDPYYEGTIEALRKIAQACKDNGLGFWFETGQETPVTLFRAITDIGTGNLGVNLDPANLLLYGRGNPVDALDILGPYVQGVHAKDGDYPTEPNKLGREYPLGEGKVNFPVLIPKLRSFGFDNPITIEREISGPKQIEDIQRAIAVLTPLIQ